MTHRATLELIKEWFTPHFSKILFFFCKSKHFTDLDIHWLQTQIYYSLSHYIVWN